MLSIHKKLLIFIIFEYLLCCFLILN